MSTNEDEHNSGGQAHAGWWKASNDLIDKWPQVIGVYGTLLLMFYLRVANKDSESWYAAETIGNRIGMTSKTVRKYTKVIQELGLITVQFGGHADIDCNLITLTAKGRNLVPTPSESNSRTWERRSPKQGNKFPQSTTQEGRQRSTMINNQETDYTNLPEITDEQREEGRRKSEEVRRSLSGLFKMNEYERPQDSDVLPEIERTGGSPGALD